MSSRSPQRRSVRRHHLARIKKRMVAMVGTWAHGREMRHDPKRIGELAATHGTHQCVMCRFDKLFRKRRASSLRDTM